MRNAHVTARRARRFTEEFPSAHGFDVTIETVSFADCDRHDVIIRRRNGEQCNGEALHDAAWTVAQKADPVAARREFERAKAVLA